MSQSNVGFRAFFTGLNQKLEPPVQQHLKNVYACVAISTLAAALGAYVHLFTAILQAGFLSALASIGFLIALIGTPDSGKNRAIRLGYLTAFSFLLGLGLGPVLELAIEVNPTIIPTAFLSSCLIFACFTFAAMFGNHSQYLFLGGTLMSLFSVMSIVGLLGIFSGSFALLKLYIYFVLPIMCGFVMYDTMLIIEKCRHGDRDYIWHSLDLFLDFIKIFRHVLVILIDKDAKVKSKKN